MRKWKYCFLNDQPVDLLVSDLYHHSLKRVACASTRRSEAGVASPNRRGPRRAEQGAGILPLISS